jgi:hypothetical protein
MPVIVGPARSRRSNRVPSSAILTGLIALGAAVSFAGYSNQHMATALADTIGQAAKSVASMFAGRSPGHRPKGKLASLKHKRPLLHARVLPKVRHLVPVVPAVLEAPPMTPPDFGPVPVYNVVAGFPEAPIIVGPPVPYGPPILPEIPPPGGGGGFFPPPIITQQVPPPPPPPAVPEPASWATMLLGFAAIGTAFRRRRTSMVRVRCG